MRITRDAMEVLHEAAEVYLINMFENANLLVVHSKRVTIMDRDITLWKKLKQTVYVNGNQAEDYSFIELPIFSKVAAELEECFGDEEALPEFESNPERKAIISKVGNASRCCAWNRRGDILAIGTEAAEIIFVKFDKNMENKKAEPILERIKIHERDCPMEPAHFDKASFKDANVEKIIFNNTDQNICVSASRDRMLRFWSVSNVSKSPPSASKLAVVNIKSFVVDMMFCNRSNTLYVCTENKKMLVFDTDNLQSFTTHDIDFDVYVVILSMDDKHLFMAGDFGDLHIYSTKDKITKILQVPVACSKRSFRVGVLDPVRNHLVLGNTYAQIQVIDLSQMICIHEYNGMKKTIRHMSYSPCGKYLAIGSDDEFISILNGETFQEVSKIDKLEVKCRFLSFNPRHRILVYKDAVFSPEYRVGLGLYAERGTDIQKRNEMFKLGAKQREDSPQNSIL
uniref:Histone domain-containing protein n=1 Tax=Rhabditophanes sp. KR3021 TaxID=114890 RepID=A0AC35TKA7_9BILA